MEVLSINNINLILACLNYAIIIDAREGRGGDS